ncbi:MAG TPA: AAA family ATPase [Candidatus Dormibacteraeota bacterium]
MPAEIVGRDAELKRVAAVLDAAVAGPTALFLSGEAGIGKTTLWEAGVNDARRRKFHVLLSRPVESEAALSYAGLADLLAAVPQETLDRLPPAQGSALEAALLRGPSTPHDRDHRAIATGLLGVLDDLARDAPVLIAVDDVQWLDGSSIRALEFAARRRRGRVSILAAVRGTPEEGRAAQQRFGRGDRAEPLVVRPLSLGALHHLLKRRTGRTYSRPALVRVLEVSGGNPFFALELARVLGDAPARAPGTRYPTTLAEVARARLESLKTPARGVLLAAAALAAPTIDVLAQLDSKAAAALEGAEELELLEIEGNRVRFTHPLLASGIYAMATPAQRRNVHLRVAGLGLDPEERARHLALAATTADAETVAALDEAAGLARRRGAPAAAAELLELGLRLGADTPRRRLAAAHHHFDSGDPLRARALLEELIAREAPGPMRAEAESLLASVRLHDDSYAEAAGLLEQALLDVAEGSQLRVRIQLQLCYVLTNLGRIDDALLLAERVVLDAQRLGDPALQAVALASSTITKFLNGQGLDEAVLERALALEDPLLGMPIMFRPTMIAGLLLMWVGRLDQASEIFYRLRRECLERGEETDLMFVAFHTVMLECWRGDLGAARAVADDTHERALQLGTDVPLATALSTIANAAAYEGRASEAREAAERALAIFQRGTCLVATLWPLATLGFLELSTGDFAAAAARLAPMANGAAAMGVREPVCIPFAADAAEALIALGRTDEATSLVDQLEAHGRRLDRAWALAAGGRCRALLLGAAADLTAAVTAAETALLEHDRLDMPFDRARTLLVLGTLQRRQGRRRAAAETLDTATEVFEALGTSHWAARARAEASRLGLQPGQATALTPTEQRVAELAGTGRTNREVAATLGISPKTVEANLARVYQKLDIHSRAELGRRMAAVAN